MKLGREQIHHPDYSLFEKLYIAIFGMPIIGLRIRGRNIFSIIPSNKFYGNILDAGSGPGVFTFELARRFPRAQVLGVDLLPESIKACNHIAKKIDTKNVTFSQTAIDDLPHDKLFDLVLCVDILEHIENDAQTLHKLSELLAPDGILVLHVPALYRRYPIWKKNLNFHVESHVRTGYELDEIKSKVGTVGLKIINSGYTYGFWETLANNLSYMITKARMKNKIAYAVAFPFLHFISLIGAGARPAKLGAGIYLIGTPSNELQ